jgi:hypothetical protein
MYDLIICNYKFIFSPTLYIKNAFFRVIGTFELNKLKFELNKLSFPRTCQLYFFLYYSDTSANEDNSFRNHIS